MSSVIYKEIRNHGYSTVMPRASRTPIPEAWNSETIGQRIARLRKERGLTQKELAEKVGIIQVLVSDYEKGKLRLHAEMVVRFARALGIRADELLGLTSDVSKGTATKPDLKIMRRLNRIASLPPKEQKIMLKAIDGWLQASQRKAE